MSYRKCLYLGPYVECTYKPSTRTEYTIGCTSKRCKNHPRERGPDAYGKFCSACGSPNGRIPFEVADHPDHVEITKETLYEINSERGGDRDDLLWLAPNVSRKGTPRRNFDDEEPFHLDLGEVDADGEIIWFQNAFAKELRKLEAAYATVTVKWGLHQFFL